MCEPFPLKVRSTYSVVKPRFKVKSARPLGARAAGRNAVGTSAGSGWRCQLPWVKGSTRRRRLT